MPLFSVDVSSNILGTLLEIHLLISCYLIIPCICNVNDKVLQGIMHWRYVPLHIKLCTVAEIVQ